MTARRTILILSAALLLAFVGTWIEQRSLEPIESEEAKELASGKSTSPGLGDGASMGPLSEISTELLLEEFTGSWTDRYPDAVVAEARLATSRNGFPRLQFLLSRNSERMPWILWEEKLEIRDGGEIASVGSIAHMGNVFLVDADPLLVAEEALGEFARDHGLFVERESTVANYVCFGFADPELGKIEALLAAFQQRFPGAVGEFDTLSFPSATPIEWDPSRMWGLDQIKAEDAWTFEAGDPDNEVVVAVIDTGTQRSHPDLAANLFVNPRDSTDDGVDNDRNGLRDDVSGWDFYDGDANPEDLDGHGTHVAGIVGAVGNNGQGAVGVNWGVRILPLKAGGADGLRTSSINDALAYVATLKEAGINIVATNNSYGSSSPSVTTRAEIAKHEQLGILFVAAAGNEGRNLDTSADSLEYPAGYNLENIISVGNSNQEDALNQSSNFGNVSVDLSAPGSDIYSTYPTNSYEFLSGTSMAAPMVAGAIGLLAQARPELAADQLKARILETADAVDSQAGLTVTGKRLNLLAALRPELNDHFVAVENVPDALVLVGVSGLDVVFEVDAKESAGVAAELVSGSEVGELLDLGDRRFRFETKANGQATIRFFAQLGGLRKSIEKTVVVGSVPSPDQGLSHHFAFDGSGNAEPDLAGGGSASIVGASRVASDYGSSLSLDAASENMNFDGAFSDRVTIAALVRSDDLLASPHPRIVNMPYYYLYFSSGNNLDVPDGNRQTLKFLANYTGFGVWNTPPRSVRDGEWYYVVGSYDSRNIMNTPSLYINGDRQKVRLQQPPEGIMNREGGLSYVGNSDIGNRAFEGLMADVRVYNRELSSEEVMQLGASLLESRWSQASLQVPDLIEVGKVGRFRFLDTGIDDAAVVVDWNVESASEASILSESGVSAEMRFEVAGRYRVTAHVSDGLATRVLAADVDVREETVAAGHFVGGSAGGGVAWLEVEASLETGFVTVFDVESGFYRIREPVTIEPDGAFSSLEEGTGRIQGFVLGGFSLEIPGRALLFTGDQQSTPSSVSDFAGDYRGGGIGVPGDSIEMKALGDGRVFLWREGPHADLALGALTPRGKVSIIAASGTGLELSLDIEDRTAQGFWGDQKVFLRDATAARVARLMAGVVGGFPSGSGGTGLYAEFLAKGEGGRSSLERGGFSGLGSSPEAGPFILLGAKGKSLLMAGDKRGEALADAVAAAIAGGALELGSREIGGVRLQVPIGDAAAGLVGFAVAGPVPLELLVRGLGPSFSEFGAEDPKIVIYKLQDGEAFALSPNDNWRDGALFAGEGESAQGAFRALATGFEALGLSPLADDAKDAAQRVWLEAGDYLVLIQVAEGEAGSALIEVLAL
ncbi:S8 family serine peptidase [Pelagicoccus enzymogenes]|uniref:S8 family serine peptidase n=1 Tax=Pelagicoccus enzymogenes TaxID=2773457 RepID=UPI00280D2A79|nr:S8 family serine peptidase [Pelagicoccus enzymogenes]MDQ8198384.1 S8 family serine peptidase [Pelagicoccus enzymogenes]